ncbi:hypothetical protein TI03_04195 [Achromatium sp. WMS1]|nr:hypothetical protein TI03_04195 [Achromatium sp. WMS1]
MCPLRSTIGEYVIIIIMKIHSIFWKISYTFVQDSENQARSRIIQAILLPKHAHSADAPKAHAADGCVMCILLKAPIQSQFQNELKRK